MMDGSEFDEKIDYNWEENGILVPFDQREFMGDQPSYGKYSFYPRGMTDYGWMYYPKACVQNKCKLHVVFSGSGDYSVDTLEDVFGSWNSQFNYGRIASSNNLILLFPQQVTAYSGCYEY